MSNGTRFEVEFQVQLDTGVELPLTRLEQAIAWVLDRHEQADGTGVSVVITDDDAMRQMNRDYRGIDKPTDVLSFEAEPIPGLDTDTEAPYVGDLILALPYIQKQARSEGHDWQDEMVLAVIHGTLHLLGYDHDTPENQRKMWLIQAEALSAMDVAIIVPLFEFDDDETDSSSFDTGDDEASAS